MVNCLKCKEARRELFYDAIEDTTYEIIYCEYNGFMSMCEAMENLPCDMYVENMVDGDKA